ncbi:LuxR family transcriptional regulator [Lentilitoribacter sp. EG35]|jgi:DNA-binding CsgD family transcriptional regulator|uniref:LuxR family transcriptional regulator n=1 Tax=Lentilitoribacter sp. EG35 TaxID=3234192 RepID=UPI0034606D9B
MAELDGTIEDFLGPLARAKSDVELVNEFRSLARFYNLSHVALFCVGITGRADEAPSLAVTYSGEWIQHYVDENFANIDPVLSMGFNSMIPIDWRDIPTSGRKVKRMFGEAREFGIGRQGITFSVKGRNAERALFSINSDMKDWEWDSFLNGYLRLLQLYSFEAFETYLRIRGVERETVLLAKREIECLKWVSAGKTASEIADILDLSERTVRFYLETARYKLKANTVAQAVANAIYTNQLTRSW